jgi:HSP20 family molecular chaperone IbpA
MTEEKPNKPSRADLLEELRQLKDKVRHLQEGPETAADKAQGLAEGVVSALGKMVPGLGKLIETAAKMPEFHQRLAAIDEEVQHRFKEQPLLRAGQGLASRSGRRMGIPPSVRRPSAGRSGAGSMGQGGPTAKQAARGRYREPGPPRVHISPQTPAELPVDVFDEGDRVIVLAEAPGLKREEVVVSVEGRTLLIRVAAPSRTGLQRVELPFEPGGEPEVSLSNGILTIHVRKANAT